MTKTQTELQAILTLKEQLDNDEIIGMVAVRELLEHITNIVTDNQELNSSLNAIYSVLEDTDSLALWEDLDYLEDEFENLTKFVK